LRFGDRDAQGWAERFSLMKPDENTVIGGAIHSVRAVPADQMSTVVKAVNGRPIHVHVSEQVKENEECQAAYRVTPTQLLYDHAVLGPATTAIHATHLTRNDIALLGGSGSGACMCPTTERDLGDGVGPVDELARDGAPISLGTDQHVFVDPFEEMRGLEMNLRITTGERVILDPSTLVTAATTAGHRALGWPTSGNIAVGNACDLVAIDLESVRNAGADPAQVVVTASAADVHTVIAGGRAIVTDRQHEIGDVAQLLEKAISPLWT
jgi:formiminoglutamate deiminase